MKKTIFFLTSIACTITLYALAPYIANKLSANIIKSETINISVDGISPWKTIASITIKEENLNLFLPKLVANYQISGLSERKIASLDLQGGSIIILNQQASDKTETEYIIPPILVDFINNLPMSVNDINIKNLHLFVEELDLNFFLNGTISINTKDNKNKELQKISTNFIITGDLKSQLTGDISFTTEGFTTNLHTEHQLAEIKKFLPLAATSTLGGHLAIDTKIQSDYKLNNPVFNIKIAGTPKLADSNYIVNSTGNTVEVEAEGNLNNISIKTSSIKLSTPVASQIAVSTNINLQDDSFTSEIDFKIDGVANSIAIASKGSKSKINTQITLPQNIDFAGMHISGNNKINATTKLIDNNLTTKITGAVQKIKFDDLTTKKIKFTEDISFTNNALTTNGKLTIDQIIYQNNYVGNISLEHTLKENNLSFNSKINSAIKNLNLKCDGKYKIGENSSGNGKCQTTIPELSEIDLPRFLQQKLPENLQFSSAIKLNSEFTIEEKPIIKTSIELENGQANFGEDLKISGINTQITIPDLLRKQSLPSQNMSIDQINVGTINISNLNAYYRLENFHSLFLEKSTFNWAGGLVESNSLRVDTMNDKYDLTLYCDRLNLSQILSQFGIPEASGNGSLNGRLPVSWSQGKFQFDDGFLFSSPGKSGIVKFTDTKYLRNSLGENTDAPYMNYSMEAMGNFQYNWASLQFNTQDDSLLVSMTLDGKPAVPLPYAYQSGNIVYKEDGSGLQHPLNLSINFKLPLTEILRYGQTFQSIME